MSNSIWHKAGFHEAIDNKLKSSKDGKWIYWTMYGWNIAGEDVHDIGVEWAYLTDIIAQADKAERLQKAVDLAIHSFNEICAGVPSDIWVFDEATKATNEIKQLIKGE